ncbi:MAG: hypothetical protein IKK57_07800 [Clostridia bacterium]|nr:hypothetical protein [Clostridia bacterium]
MLRAALDTATAALCRAASPAAAAIGTELCIMRDAIAPPEAAYPGLTALDKALTEAINSMAALAEFADPADTQQAITTLRRILLVDRRRFDPDPDAGSLSLAIALRRLWLIPHRAELLKARHELAQVSQALEKPDAEPDAAALRQTQSLLQQYIAAQESYGDSIRNELADLYAQQLM